MHTHIQSRRSLLAVACLFVILQCHLAVSKRPPAATRVASLSNSFASSSSSSASTVNTTTSRLVSEAAVIGSAALVVIPEPPPPRPPPLPKNRIAADFLRESLLHQNDYVGHAYQPKLSRVRGGLFVKRSQCSDERGRSASSASRILPGSPGYALRVGIAGGIAGATGTALLYPIDAAKTLRQSNPALNKSVRQALWNLCWEKGQGWHVQRAYKGLIPATLGAIPSSALYFGAYETMKNLIRKASKADPTTSRGRLLVHALSAASGNILSSAVFVPKEVIKQCMQYDASCTIWSICKKRGIRGLYTGYSATLMRNIPSAILRFTLYEEFKYRWHTANADDSDAHNGFNLKLFAAGALAGAIASGFMTPIDVLKTRLSTGTCPVPTDMPTCIQYVVRDQGWGALYAGAGSRMLWSGAFTAIGFGMLEASKGWLGVADRDLLLETTAKSRQSSSSSREQKRKKEEATPGAACSRPQRSLGNAILNDALKGAARIIQK